MDSSRLVNATAVVNGEEDEFYFYVQDSLTDKEILDKAFEIAYCKYTDLDSVTVDSIE